MDKNQRKNTLKGVKKPEISAEKEFLDRLYNNTKLEIKKANSYINALNHDLKTIKKLLEEVK